MRSLGQAEFKPEHALTILVCNSVLILKIVLTLLVESIGLGQSLLTLVAAT